MYNIYTIYPMLRRRRAYFMYNFASRLLICMYVFLLLWFLPIQFYLLLSLEIKLYCLFIYYLLYLICESNCVSTSTRPFPQRVYTLIIILLHFLQQLVLAQRLRKEKRLHSTAQTAAGVYQSVRSDSLPRAVNVN